MHFHIFDLTSDEEIGEIDCDDEPTAILESLENADYIVGGDEYRCTHHIDDSFEVFRKQTPVLYLYGPYAYSTLEEESDDAENEDDFEDADD